jgi:hypothetical protein
MLTAAQCQKYADQYKSLAREADTSEQRAVLLKNIARSYASLANQLDRLAALLREETQSKVSSDGGSRRR